MISVLSKNVHMCPIPNDFQDSLNLVCNVVIASAHRCCDCLLTVVIVEMLLKMPHIFTNVKSKDMLYVYSF